MSTSLADHLNDLPEKRARAELLTCCSSSRWARVMAAARPFAGDTEVFAEAERVWWRLDRSDWLEAFAGHPRIGDRAVEPRHAATGAWSEQEQSGARRADEATREALAAGNAEYERRFGHVFLICATGRSAEEMLAELRRRLGNEASGELREAAGEQAKITRLRLERLVDS